MQRLKPVSLVIRKVDLEFKCIRHVERKDGTYQMLYCDRENATISSDVAYTFLYGRSVSPK